MIIALVVLAALPNSGPFEVEAERLSATIEPGIYLAEGDVTLRRPGLVVHADRMTFDERTQRARAEGNVVLVEGASVLTCDAVELKVPELDGGIASAELRIKRGLSHAALARLPRDEVAHAADDELILTADRVDRTSRRTYDITGGSFTPCDCGPDSAPSWRIDAAKASIDLDSGAWLTWPVFYAKKVPVMALPVFYVPLGERRTGLLLPKFSNSSASGIALSLPVFITLGRSWDTTIEARHFFERGPAPIWELRWAPSPRSEGWLRSQVLFDFGEAVDRDWNLSRSDPIVRFAIGGEHHTRWDESQVAVALSLAGDPAFVAEFSDEFLARQAEMASSSATYTVWTDAGVRVATGIALRQDLRASSYPGLALREVNLLSDDQGPGDVRYRFAEFRADAPVHPLFSSDSPLLGEAALSAQVFAAPHPRQPRFARADLRPAVSMPIDLSSIAVLEPSVALRLTGWTGRADSTSINESRFAVIARTQLFTEVWRDFGGVRHRIRPQLQHAIVPVSLGDGPGLLSADDEVDQLGRVHQVSARLDTDVWSPGRRWLHVGASFGRDLGLFDEPALGNGALVVDASASFPLGPVEGIVNGLIAYDVDRGAFEERVAQLILSLPNWAGVGALWTDFGDAVPRRTLIGPEEIAPSATVPVDGFRWRAQQGLVLSASVTPWAPLTLAYAMTLDFEPTLIRNVQGSLRYESPCDCWGASLVVGKAADREEPDIRFLISLDRLGEVGN